MASAHITEKKRRLPSEDMLHECSRTLDLGANLYLKILRLQDIITRDHPEYRIEIDCCVTEMGGVLIHIASLVVDGNDVERIRTELVSRGVGNVI